MGGYVFKSIIVGAILCVSFSSYSAVETKAEMKENFKKCAAADESWMRRWGNYWAGDDLYPTLDLCRKKGWPSTNITINHIGCYIDGKWARAGYYCINR